MTIINKPDFNIFASEAKSGEVTTFPNLLRGWGVTIDQTAGKPPMEWFNALQKRTDEWLTYLSQRGLPEWQNTLDYPKDAVVQFGGKFYVAKKNTKNAQPDRSQNDWAVMLGSAASRDVGTGKGNVMEVGAFGIGGGGFEFNYTNNADLMAALRAKGSCIFRNTKDGTAMSSWAPGLFAHAGDANCMITINPFTGNVIAAGFTDGNKDSPKVNTLYGTANKPTAADVGAYSKEEMDELLHGRLLNVQKFTESGTYTPTPGTRYVIVEAVGGGGGGGGCSSTNGNTAAISGGGASGSYIRAEIDITKVGGSIGVSIGAGGSGGVAGKSGGAGGDTRFGVLATATGGLGGTSSTSASSTAFVAVGGAPGSTPTGGNLISSQGSRGGSGIFFNSSTGAVGGDGASSPLGGGGVGSGSSGTTGTNGSGFGAGGGGNARQPSSAANNGYSGSPGILIICEYS
ncbi:hypothetical protein SMQC20_28700 [Serratia marcescens]|nr:hypothetical protein SMQC20_28700 [Serratia marcescens]